MSWLDKLLESYGASVMSEAPQKTANCPAMEELERLADSPEGDGAWRKEMVSHVVDCGYCANRVIGILRGWQELGERIGSINARLYPLPAEIEWKAVKKITLYRENISECSHTFDKGSWRHTFTVSRPGFYHLGLDSGQVVWRRRLLESELSLSEAERKEAVEYGMAAGVESVADGITAFDESLWDGVLSVTLVKRISSGKLLVTIQPV